MSYYVNDSSYNFYTMNKLALFFLVLIILLQSISCKSDDDVILAVIGDKKIYRSQIDSMIIEEIEGLRENALKVKISKTLFDIEAAKRKMSTEELKQNEIYNKSKPINESDILSYAESHGIFFTDTSTFVYIRNQISLLNIQSRFELFIDSLKKAYGTQFDYMLSKSKTHKINDLYSQAIGNKKSNTNLYIIADYDCPSCRDKCVELFKLCAPLLNKIQIHFIYYSNYISQKALLGEAIARQGKFWEVSQLLFKLDVVNDSVINAIATQYQLNAVMLKNDIDKKTNKQLLVDNQKILEELMIYSVPTYIINDEILPEYYSTDKLLQIINYKITNN